MKKNLIIILAGLCVVASCNKKNDILQGPQPPVTDAKTILLKEINIERLPSPFFQFVYDNSGFVTQIGFASQLNSWQVQYKNNRVIRMIDGSHDTLAYTYNNDRVAIVRHTRSSDSAPLWQYDFSYDNTGLLKQIRYWSFHAPGVDSTLYRKVNITYFSDGNLQQYVDSTVDVTNQLALAAMVTFSGYDQNINVDDLGLLKNFFEDFLFLPQVKLQKNNPAHEIYVSVETDYLFDFTYQYNSKKLPLVKGETFLVTRGTDIGFQGTASTQFTYY